MIQRWDVGQIEQLGLGLNLEDSPALATREEGEMESQAEITIRKEAVRRAFELRMRKQAMGIQDAGDEVVTWTDEYVMLREAGWPWEAAIYVAWAASPKKERWPRTLAELATECLGLTGPRRIFEWRKKNPAIDETVAMLQAAPLLQHRRDIYEALIESATQQDYKGFNDRKLALELLGDYVPQSKLRLMRTEPTSEEEMSDEELRALLGEGPAKAWSSEPAKASNPGSEPAEAEGSEAGEEPGW
jgi:hypothetical protein